MKNLLFLSVIIALLTLTGCNHNESKKTRENLSSGALLTMPYNKILTPAGTQLFFGDPGLENHALDVALSPDKKTVAVEGRYSIVFINTATNKIIHRFVLRSYDKSNAMNTYSGITWFVENNKQYLLWGTRNNVLKALWNGKTAEVVKTYNFQPKKGVRASIPNEIVVKKENDKPVAYVVLNGNDEVVKIGLETGNTIWKQPVGLAPYGICFANNKLYVTNWSGTTRQKPNSVTAGIPWEKALVDRYGTAASGSVSVLNPQSGAIIKEIKTGLHPNDIICNAQQSYVFVANGNDDNITVIDTKTDKVAETIPVRLNKDSNPYFGDSPNGLAITSNGSTLYVANGMDNALAVVKLGNRIFSKSTLKQSRVTGFIPTAAYPGGICLLNDQTLYVANIESVGAKLTVKENNKAFHTFYKGTFDTLKSTAGAFNAHRMLASVSVIPVPDNNQLKDYSKSVIDNNRQNRLALLKLLPRKGVKPVPLPQRIGEPSVFKHVVYIIKENRTYDQILGDIKKANGDANLCTFGKKVTPNAHKLVNSYVLLDNYKASGKCSSEGHVWTDASIVTDYIEKNVRAWFRSYTHVLYDAMAYPKTGFLWDNALDHGKSVRIYGEACKPVWKGKKTWTDIYNGFLQNKPFEFTNNTTIDRVRGILSPNYPGYDSHNIPDVLRARAFIYELKTMEKMEKDVMPDLSIIALPDDHTAGTSSKHPTPRAMVADNDYALGQIIDALSRSKYWKNTVVFVTEDDSQSGWDHVSAYRTVGMVISPYSKTGKVISTDYNQTSMIRTIEQILGLPPMNIMDATATPMFDVFSEEADFTPYHVVKNQIPLNEMNPPLTALSGEAKRYALQSEQMALKGIDAGDDNLFNRIIWSSVQPDKPYPEKFAGEDDDD